MDTSATVVIIPCYNAYTTIKDVVTDVKKFITDVIVVDDGSQDQSAEFAKKSGAKVISMNKNSGVGKATQTGLQLALENKNVKEIITLDADAAHNPSDILSLLSWHRRSNSVLTIGNRWGNYDVHIPCQKWWANQFASALVNNIASTKIPDVACGFRVFSRELSEQLSNNSMEKGFGFIYQQIFLAKKIGLIEFAPIGVRYDANFLLSTKQNELLHLIDISRKYCTDPRLHNVLCRMTEEANLMGKICVNLTNYNNYLILYPLTNQQSYLFQWQHPDFVTQPSDFHEI